MGVLLTMKAVLPLLKVALSLIDDPEVWASNTRAINNVRLLDQLLLVDSKAN